MNPSFDKDYEIRWCIFAWTSVALIWKNIIFLAILTPFRLNEKQIRIPEDARAFGRQRRIATEAQLNDGSITNDDWSTTYRIGRVLGNETEYVTYFLVFFFAFISAPGTTTTRQLVYGGIFVIARYVHNFGLIFRNSYARMIGFLFSILVLGAITLDLAINITIGIAERTN